MADHTTCSWGNWGWRDNSIEPPLGERPTYNNSTTNNYSYLSKNTWDGLYSVIEIANAVIDLASDAGYSGDDKEKLLTAAYFIKGASLGQIAMTYDQGVDIIDNVPTLIPWEQVLTQAVENLNLTVTHSATAFSLSAGTVSGMDMTNDYLAALANS